MKNSIVTACLLLLSETTFASNGGGTVGSDQDQIMATKLTLICKVRTVGERTDNTKEEKISFNANNGYETLKFVADGQKLEAEIISSMTADGKLCENSIVRTCLRTAAATTCSEDTELTVYGQNAFQPGNYTTVNCRAEGDTSRPCAMYLKKQLPS